MAIDQRSKTVKITKIKKKNIDFILSVIEAETGLNVLDPTRKRQYVDARAMACFIMSRNLKLTLTQIGEIFNKNHATVLHSLKLFENLYETDYRFKEKFDKIEGIYCNKTPVEEPVDLKDEHIKKIQKLYDNKIKVLTLENNKLKNVNSQYQEHPYADIVKMIYDRLKPNYKDEFKRKVNSILNGVQR